MYVGLYAICEWNWNWWLTEDHFLIKHWSQRTHRCSAPAVGLEEYSLGLVSRYSTVRSETVTWRKWGLWSRKLVLGALKIRLQNDGRLKFLSLHTHLEGQSSKLVFKTAMKMCCKQYLTVLKRASRLGFKTSRKRVLRALKICLQNDRLERF